MARQTQGPDVGSQPIRDESKRDFMKVAAAAGAMAVLGRNSLAWASDKDTIRIGYISPKTGPFSPFAEADDFILGQVRKSLADGLTIGGKKYAVEILARDDQSNPDRQSNLAAELINKDNIDLMLAQVAIGPNASQQCELNGVPCISTVGPWQAWMFPLKGDPSKGFKNVFHFFWGLEDIVAVYEDIWQGRADEQGDRLAHSPTTFPAMPWATCQNGNARCVCRRRLQDRRHRPLSRRRRRFLLVYPGVQERRTSRS